ncbi:MAG: hypothetical protein ABR591_09285 [Candidatus Velthaea sp.]
MNLTAKPLDAPIAPSDVALTLREAQQRAVERRMEVEALLFQARSIEEQLAAEAVQAEAAREVAHAQGHHERARVAAEREREAAQRIDMLTKKRLAASVERTAAQAHVVALRSDHANANEAVRACEQRLAEARMALEKVAADLRDAEAYCNEVSAAAQAVTHEEREAGERLVEHRGQREAAELEARAAEERARALVGDAPPRPPSLAPLDELRTLESHVAISAEAAKRAADRRAADALRAARRNGVAGG